MHPAVVHRFFRDPVQLCDFNADVTQSTGQAKFGHQFRDHVARALPHLVDQATPEGMVPQQGMGAMKSGMGSMKDGAMKDSAGKGMNNMKSMPRK